MEKNILTKSPARLLLSYSIPTIVGMLVQSIYNIVDRIFIGNDPTLGKEGLAAAAVGFPIMLIVLGFGLLFAAGGSTFFSVVMGQKDVKKAESIMQNTFVVCLLFGILIMIFGNLFIDKILVLLGASQAIMPLAKEYFSIIFYGTPFSMLTMFGNQFSRAQGNPRNTMHSLMFGAVFNIVFDYVFIFHMGMGMSGAALATVLSQVASTIWQLLYIMGKRASLRLTLNGFRFNMGLTLKIGITGIPSFVVQTSFAVVSIILNHVAKTYGGDMGLSVIAVYSSIQTITQLPLVGFMQGQSTIVSYCYGAKYTERIKSIIRISIIIVLSYSMLWLLAIEIIPAFIVRLFNSDINFVSKASSAIRIAFCCIPFGFIQSISANVFQSVRKIKEASILNLLRQVLLLIPLAIILPKIFGFTGLFAAAPLCDFISFVITIYMLIKLNKEFDLL